MIPRITQIALLVRDYDEAIIWFGQALGFVVLKDSDLGDGKRWGGRIEATIPLGARGTNRGCRVQPAVGPGHEREAACRCRQPARWTRRIFPAHR